MADEQQQSRQELLQYFERVEGMLDSSDFDDEESKELFITNVFEEVKGKEKRLSCDLQCSRVLEKLLSQAPLLPLNLFTLSLYDEFEDLLGNRYASHVLQAIVAAVHRMTKQFLDEDDDEYEDKKRALAQLQATFLSLAKTLIANIYEAVTGTYSGHVFRSVMLCLAGMPLPDKLRARSSRGYREHFQQKQAQDELVSIDRLPDSFIETLNSAAGTMQADAGQLAEWLYHLTASPCIQTLLQALDRINTTASRDALCTAILGSCNEDSPLTTAIATPVASHVIEACLQVGSDSLVQQIFDQGFRSQCLEQATHGISNFVFQRLLRKASASAVETACDELLDNLEDVLAEGTGAVLVELIKAAGRCQTRQGHVIKALATAFHFNWDEHGGDVARCLLSVSTLERWQEMEKEEGGVKMHLRYTSLGSQFVQAIATLDASCNKNLVNAVGKLTSQEFYDLACHKHGSFALQALLTSPSVGNKRKSKLVTNLLPTIADIAMNRFGSHIVDAAWAAAGIKTKEAMAAALVDKESQVKEAPQGKFVWRNCKLDLYKRNKEDWSQAIKSAERKRRMLVEMAADKNSKTGAKDEIDELFAREATAPAKKRSKSSSKKTKRTDTSTQPSSSAADNDLEYLKEALETTKDGNDGEPNAKKAKKKKKKKDKKDKKEKRQ